MTFIDVHTAQGYDDLPRLMSLMTGDEKHGPAATSTLDVVWVLYDRVLRVSPEAVDAPDRDRFLLSKGHGPMAYYAVLAAKGFLPESWLPGFGAYESPLGHHPDRVLVPGAEISSGSLGHGLPLAVGSALGLRARGLSGAAVWVLVGDAELDEGSNHEAIAYAGAVGLERLHTVVVDNAPGPPMAGPGASPRGSRSRGGPRRLWTGVITRRCTRRTPRRTRGGRMPWWPGSRPRSDLFRG
ncbi:transketolase [Stenotrophomonas sp. NPDC087984]